LWRNIGDTECGLKVSEKAYILSIIDKDRGLGPLTRHRILRLHQNTHYSLTHDCSLSALPGWASLSLIDISAVTGKWLASQLIDCRRPFRRLSVTQIVNFPEVTSKVLMRGLPCFVIHTNVVSQTREIIPLNVLSSVVFKTT
jgi:hypothetical protein